MSQPLTCPHSAIGICVPCYHERIAAGVEMPEPDPDVCICGRTMESIWWGRDEDYYSSGVSITWCKACGVVHVHRPDWLSDARHIPDPKYIGQR
jgi:hypothetical protein